MSSRQQNLSNDIKKFLQKWLVKKSKFVWRKKTHPEHKYSVTFVLNVGTKLSRWVSSSFFLNFFLLQASLLKIFMKKSPAEVWNGPSVANPSLLIRFFYEFYLKSRNWGTIIVDFSNFFLKFEWRSVKFNSRASNLKIDCQVGRNIRNLSLLGALRRHFFRIETKSLPVLLL